MLNKKLKAFAVCALLLVCLFALTVSPLRAQSADVDSLKERAAALLKQSNYVDALPLLEKIVILEPDDAENQFNFGAALLAKTRVTTDKEEIKQLFVNARKALVKAKQLGHPEPKLDAIIKSIPEDGNIPDFSKSSETEVLMDKAEAAFAQGKMDEALKNYQAALKLDPKLYSAALFSGDAYVQKGDFPNAEIWYQKAIEIDPTRETAYRYSATPLMKQKKYDQARDRYVEAYISEPFNDYAIGGLNQWAQVTGARLGHPRIDIPASVKTAENGNLNITLGLGDDTRDGSFVWTAYGISRATWQTAAKNSKLSEKFMKAYPNETIYRHSLAEELDALKMSASLLKERMNDKKNPVKNPDPQLVKLVKLYDDDLLEPYILLVLADKEIYQDYAPYLKQHRDKMRRYVVEYVLTGGGK